MNERASGGHEESSEQRPEQPEGQPDGRPGQQAAEQPGQQAASESPESPGTEQPTTPLPAGDWAETTPLPASEWESQPGAAGPRANEWESQSQTASQPTVEQVFGVAPGALDAPPAAPRAAGPSPTAAYVRAVFAPRGLVTAAWVAGSTLLIGLVSAVCLVGALGAASGEVPDFGTAAAGLLVGLGVVLGGGLAVRGDVDAGFFAASGSASLTIFAIGTLVAVSAGAALVARLRARGESPAPSAVAELARAAIEAGAVAIAMMLLTVFAALGEAAGLGGVVIRSRGAMVVVVVFLVVGVTLFLSRASLRRRVSGQPDGRWAVPFREAGRYLAAQFAVFGVVALVALVVIAVRAESVAAFFGLLPFLGNVAGIAAVLGHLGGVTAASGFTDTSTGLAWDLLGWHSAWLIAAAVISIVAGALFVGARRPYATHPQVRRPDWRRVWQLPVVVFAIWCVLALGLLGATATGELTSMMDVAGVGSVGLAWYVPFAMGIAAAATSLLAEFAPLWLARVNPRWAAALAAPATMAPAAAASPAAAATASGASPYAPPGSPAAASQTQGAEVQGASAQGFAQDPAAPSSPAVAGAAAAQAGTASPPPAPAPLSRKTKVTLITVFGSIAAVGILVAAAAITVSVMNQQRDPAAAVEDYLTLLEEGKADEATELVDPGLQNAERELLTDEVMAGAAHRIEVVDVETTERADGTASVTATMALDGERFERVFPVEAGEKELLFLDTWELREPLLVPVTLESDGAETITVGDAEVQLESSGEDDFWGGSYPTRELMVYPGVYPVGGVEDEFVTTSEEELRALPGEGEWASVAVESKPSEAFEAAILEQVQARITQCAEVPTNMDDECPYLTQDDDLDELKVVTQAEGFDEITLTDFTASEAEISVRPNPSTFNEDPDVEETSFNAYGEIEIVDGKPTVTEISLGGGLWW